MTHPLCVFLESREQGKLPNNHPFHFVVEETIQNIAQSPLILQYLAETTLGNAPYPDEAIKEQRVQEIIQHLQNNCPTFSGSDSPTMQARLTDVRAYAQCGKLDLKGKMVARKHVYIQKNLVDAWMNSYIASPLNWRRDEPGNFRILTFVLRLCLLRGLTTAIKLSFASKGTNTTVVKDAGRAHQPHPNLVHKSSNIFLEFLSQWNNSWLVFMTPLNSSKPYKNVPYHKLSYVVFTGSGLCRNVMIQSGNMPAELVAGYWTSRSFVEGYSYPCNVSNPRCLKMWDLPPTEDFTPQGLELMPSHSDKGYLTRMRAQMDWTYKAWQRMEE